MNFDFRKNVSWLRYIQTEMERFSRDAWVLPAPRDDKKHREIGKKEKRDSAQPSIILCILLKVEVTKNRVTVATLSYWALQFGPIFDRVSKVILFCFGFALRRSEIGCKNGENSTPT